MAFAGIAAFAGLLWTGCDPSRPPRGEELSLRGSKGALCLVNSECASGTCLRATTRRRRYRWRWRRRTRSSYGKCSDKDAPKAGFGSACSSDSGCKKGLACHRKEGKCSIPLKCKTFKSRLLQCKYSVSANLWPKDYRRYKRRGSRALKRIVSSAVPGFLKKRFCKIDRQKVVSYSAATYFLRSLKAKKCGAFARDFGYGVRRWLKNP